MGIRDRLRRRAPAEPAQSAPSVDGSADALAEAIPAAQDSSGPAEFSSSDEAVGSAEVTSSAELVSADTAAPLRSAYLEVPPITTAISVPKPVVPGPDSYLTTRRPVRLSAREMAHDVDPAFNGVVSANAIRPPVAEPFSERALTELKHPVRAQEVVDETAFEADPVADDSGFAGAPAGSVSAAEDRAPRQVSATAKVGVPAAPIGQLPQPIRAVGASGVSDAPRAAPAEPLLDDVPDFAGMPALPPEISHRPDGGGEDAKLTVRRVRRRGGGVARPEVSGAVDEPSADERDIASEPKTTRVSGSTVASEPVAAPAASTPAQLKASDRRSPEPSAPEPSAPEPSTPELRISELNASALNTSESNTAELGGLALNALDSDAPDLAVPQRSSRGLVGEREIGAAKSQSPGIQGDSGSPDVADAPELAHRPAGAGVQPGNDLDAAEVSTSVRSASAEAEQASPLASAADSEDLASPESDAPQGVPASALSRPLISPMPDIRSVATDAAGADVAAESVDDRQSELAIRKAPTQTSGSSTPSSASEPTSPVPPAAGSGDRSTDSTPAAAPVISESTAGKPADSNLDAQSKPASSSHASVAEDHQPQVDALRNGDAESSTVGMPVLSESKRVIDSAWQGVARPPADAPAWDRSSPSDLTVRRSRQEDPSATSATDTASQHGSDATPDFMAAPGPSVNTSGEASGGQSNQESRPALGGSAPIGVQRAPLDSADTAGIQRAPEDEDEDGLPLPHLPSGDSSDSEQEDEDGLPLAHSPSGSSLDSSHSEVIQEVPADLIREVEKHSGESIGQISVVRGPNVDARARKLSAKAYSANGKIYLPGSQPLHTRSMRKLVAHELLHVMQQRALGTAIPAEHTADGKALEAQAKSAEKLGDGSAALHTGAEPGKSKKTGESKPSRSWWKPAAAGPAKKPAESGMAVRRGGAAVVAAARQAAADEVHAHSDQGNDSGAQTGQPSHVQRAPESDSSSSVNAGQGAGGAGGSGAGASASGDGATDRASIERQARALYPTIRALLRAELVRDRERRGRMMRDD